MPSLDSLDSSNEASMIMDALARNTISSDAGWNRLTNGAHNPAPFPTVYVYTGSDHGTTNSVLSTCEVDAPLLTVFAGLWNVKKWESTAYPNAYPNGVDSMACGGHTRCVAWRQPFVSPYSERVYMQALTCDWSADFATAVIAFDDVERYEGVCRDDVAPYGTRRAEEVFRERYGLEGVRGREAGYWKVRRAKRD